MRDAVGVMIRLVENSIPVVETECWNWLACVSDNGYGQIHIDDRLWKAHRASYTCFVGPIPPDRELDHLCRNRRCINPQHLEPVTRSENVRRGMRPQQLREWHAARTHCKQGHEYTPANSYFLHSSKGLERQCRTCKREDNQRRRARLRCSSPAS